MSIWILLALVLGIVGTVFALGLATTMDDATYLFRRPTQLLRALLAMNVIVPLCAVTLVVLFSLRLHPAVKIALVALAISPVPPLLPKRALKAGGGASYTVGLLVAAAVLSIVFVPLALQLLGSVFGSAARIAPAPVARVVALTLLAPLGVGAVVRRVARGFAQKIEKSVSIAATALLVAGAVLALFTTMPAIVRLIGNGTLAAMVVLAVVGLTAGHLLGGPDPDDRAVLALTTSSRHPGVAMVIASTNFPEQRNLILAAVLLYLVVNALVSMPYQVWAQRRHAKLAHVA
jgi:bile acid:Na+ symporter, BASS family